MAMPWSRAKAIAAEYRSGKRDVKKLTALFDDCFRIQREAVEAAGHHIPMVVENVRGANPWVGKAPYHYGSFYLWGDVPALMPMTKSIKVPGFRFDGLGGSFQTASQARIKAENGIKQGGDWFNADQPSIARMCGSKSNARKAASAMIAKIPLPLAQHIARVFKP